MYKIELNSTIVYTISAPTFSLENFEGPLQLLMCLIQKDELDICGIAIKELTTQFLQVLESNPAVETSSETLSLTATLLLMKSQKLLPQQEQVAEADEYLRLEMFQNLIEYCRFKEAARLLSEKEAIQKAHFQRIPSPLHKEPGLGLERVDIAQLKTLLDAMLKRAPLTPQQLIHEEEWQVLHYLTWLTQTLHIQRKIPFDTLFSKAKCRMELIVLFLALLEMMKGQQAVVVREEEILYITDL